MALLYTVPWSGRLHDKTTRHHEAVHCRLQPDLLARLSADDFKVHLFVQIHWPTLKRRHWWRSESKVLEEEAFQAKHIEEKEYAFYSLSQLDMTCLTRLLWLVDLESAATSTFSCVCLLTTFTFSFSQRYLVIDDGMTHFSIHFAKWNPRAHTKTHCVRKHIFWSQRIEVNTNITI